MSDSRWQRIEEIFHQAAELAPKARPAFLDQACAGDEALRKEIETLLAHDAEEGGTLAKAVAEAGVGAGIMDEDLSGRAIGPYKVLGRLGAGGMGVVYKASDTRLGRDVALKVLPEEVAGDASRHARFVQEAKSASALRHPNIVTIYDIARGEGHDFIVMEYVAGKTLSQLIGRRGLKLKDAVRYAIQTADALACAHAAGIVHRDLKPSNIMVDEHEVVRVLDFGLAKLTRAEPGEGEPTETIGPKTLEGTIVGTASYMSPEQAEGKRVDARSDVFSFGAVLYEMLCGHRAFTGESPVATLAAILSRNPAPLGDEVPRDLERIVARCLRKDPARRWFSMADVKVALEEVQEESESGLLTAAEKPTHRPARWPAVLAALALVAAAVGGWVLHKSSGTPAVPQAVPLTTYPGFAWSPSFSPDGDRVAFSWNGLKQDNYDIYVKQIDAEEPVRLTKDPAPDFFPAWSPDGRQIAFLRELSGGKSGVFLIPALKGPERKLAEINVVAEASFGVGRMSWYPNGQWLVLSDRNSAQEPLALFLVSVESGEKRQLTSPLKGFPVGDVEPAVSPDGRAVVFTRVISNRSPGASDLYLLELSEDLRPTGEPVRITSSRRWTNEPAWWPDGSSILFASGNAGSNRSMWQMAIHGSARSLGEPERLPFGGESNGPMPAISRQGRVAYAHSATVANIWRLDLSRRQRVANMPMNSTRLDHVPQYSPDGKRIAFASNRSGRNEIYLCDSDGSNTVKLTSFGGPYVANPAWSPDGQRIAFVARLGETSEIYTISADGGKPEHLPGTQSRDGLASWSRDGKWIYFGANRTGKSQLWKVPAGGGDPVQVTKQGGAYGVESPDGKFVYYLLETEDEGNNTELWRVPVEGGEEIRIAGGVCPQYFAVAGRGIYFFSGWANPSIQCFNFAARKVETVAKVEGSVAWGMSVSPDGQWLLYSAIGAEQSDLMMVEKFR
jgi:Tol biopolymer transport system component/predicted Ser/Thr protein kinase